MVLAVDFESMAPSPIVVAVLAVAVAACAGVAYADNAEQCAGCTFLSSGVCQHLTDGTCWEYVWMCLRAAGGWHGGGRFGSIGTLLPTHHDYLPSCGVILCCVVVLVRC